MRAFKALIATLLLPVAAHAQGEVARTCDFRFLVKPDDVPAALRSQHPDVAFSAMRARIDRGEWVILIDSIQRVVAGDPAVAAREKQSVETQLLALRAQVAAAIAENRRSTLQRIRTDQFNILGPGPIDAEDHYRVFPNTPEEIFLAPLTPDSRRRVCWTAIAMQRLLTTFGEPARESANVALQQSVKRWDNYGSKGYSQFPWELAWNSRGYPATSFDPPSRQAIVLHPALSLELAGPKIGSVSDLAKLTTSEVLTLEPFGYLFYNNSRSFYWGGSLLVTLADERAIGGGAMFHLGPAIKGGYVWRQRDATGKRGQTAIVSADLYQLLTDTPAKLKDWKEKALAQGAAQALRRP